MSIRFDPGAPYEVEERDVPFARPAGMELQARVYRPKGEPTAPLAASPRPCRTPMVRSNLVQAPPCTSTSAARGAVGSPFGR